MYIVTHTMLPVALAALADATGLEITGRRSLRAAHLTAIGAAGALPDVLNPHLSLAARLSSWSHTVWFLPIAAVAFIFIARWIDREQWKLLTAAMIGAMALHLFCDAIAGGIAWLYPFSDDRLGTYLVHWDYWIWIDVACAISSVVLLIWLRRREMRKLEAGRP